MRLLLSTFVVAGHGYDFGQAPPGESSGGDGGGGIGLPWILGALFLTVIIVGTMLSLLPAGARARLKAAAPPVLIIAVVGAPLAAWAASARGGDKGLIVEHAIARNGAPELIVSLGDEDLNTLEATDGRRFVRVECVGRDGRVVLDGGQRWPFPSERGYDYPHAHQAASREQLQRVDRCRLRGTRARLESDVKGALR